MESSGQPEVRGAEAYRIDAEDIRRAMFQESDLLPCPFCGKRPLSIAEQNPQTGYVGAKILCGTCVLVMTVCMGGPETEAEARREVARRWNTRPA